MRHVFLLVVIFAACSHDESRDAPPEVREIHTNSVQEAENGIAVVATGVFHYAAVDNTLSKAEIRTILTSSAVYYWTIIYPIDQSRALSALLADEECSQGIASGQILLFYADGKSTAR